MPSPTPADGAKEAGESPEPGEGDEGSSELDGGEDSSELDDPSDSAGESNDATDPEDGDREDEVAPDVEEGAASEPKDGDSEDEVGTDVDAVVASEPGDGDAQLTAEDETPIVGRAVWRLRVKREALVRVAIAAAAPLAYLVLALLITSGSWHDPAHLYVGGGADPQQSMWFLRWIPWAFQHARNPWVTDYLNYPAGVNVMWNTAQPLAAILLWPITVTLGVVVAYNTEVTLALALSAWFAYIAIRRWVPFRLPAAAGGLLFGFSPYMLGQLQGHPHLVAVMTVPLLALLVDDIAVRADHHWWRDGALLGALGTAQCLLSEEILVLEAIATATVLIVLAFTHRDRWRAHRAHVVRAVCLAAGIGAVLLAWPLLNQFFGPQRAAQAIQGPDIFVSDGAGFALPTANQLYDFWPQQFSGNGSEWNAYLGIPLLALLAWVIWRNRDVMWVRVIAISATVLAVLSLGPHLHLFGHKSPLPLPWLAVGHLPLLEKLLPSRLMVLVFFAGAVLTARALADLCATGAGRWTSGRTRPLLAVAAAVIVAASLFPRLPFQVTAVTIPAYFAEDPVPGRVTSADLPAGSATLLLPIAAGVPVEPMLWQAATTFRFRMVGGYFIGPPPSDTSLTDWRRDNAAIIAGKPLPAFDLSELRAELTNIRITTVIVGPTATRAQLVALVTAALGPPAMSAGDISVWTVTSATTPPPVALHSPRPAG